MEDVWNPRLEAGVIPALMATAQQAGHPPQTHCACLGFSFLECAYDAPANDISALLMASLARKARSARRIRPALGCSMTSRPSRRYFTLLRCHVRGQRVCWASAG